MTETTGQSSTSTSAQSVRDELSQDASRLTQTATQRAEQAADGGKKQATTAAHAASSAIGKAAGALRQDDKAPEWLANAFDKTARQIDDLARTIEGKDIKEIRRGVSQFARQNPLAFLAASAAAGFAAARFLRAGSEYQSHHPEGGQGSSSATSRFAGSSYDPSASTGSGGTGPGTRAGSATGSDMGGAGTSTGFGTGSSSAQGGASRPGETTWSPASSASQREGSMS
ncbi:hypothetical protein GRI40_04015 [Altererythrobacter aerius]|uniref:Uncharacterized protein n=1 Tax=Tsuneonella aeria TaxID=1837929 RepID=A0A6I4TE35_9SPHN|nr:hypothetical protein [Tsuneonella aeria]MXO74390.1 hypothetical protein [Tsuneonella aeria]